MLTNNTLSFDAKSKKKEKKGLKSKGKIEKGEKSKSIKYPSVLDKKIISRIRTLETSKENDTIKGHMIAQILIRMRNLSKRHKTRLKFYKKHKQYLELNDQLLFSYGETKTRAQSLSPIPLFGILESITKDTTVDDLEMQFDFFINDIKKIRTHVASIVRVSSQLKWEIKTAIALRDVKGKKAGITSLPRDLTEVKKNIKKEKSNINEIDEYIEKFSRNHPIKIEEKKEKEIIIEEKVVKEKEKPVESIVIDELPLINAEQQRLFDEIEAYAANGLILLRDMIDLKLARRYLSGSPIFISMDITKMLSGPGVIIPNGIQSPHVRRTLMDYPDFYNSINFDMMSPPNMPISGYLGLSEHMEIDHTSKNGIILKNNVSDRAVYYRQSKDEIKKMDNVGTLKYPSNFLRHFTIEERAMMELPLPSKTDIKEYNELEKKIFGNVIIYVQIHGNLRFDRDVSFIILDKKYENDDHINRLLSLFFLRIGEKIKISYVD